MTKDFAGGVDVGSCSTKAVIVDRELRLMGSRVVYSGTDFEAAAAQAWDEALHEAGLSNGDVASVISTGYGRKSVPFASSNRTEISCHGRGCLHFYPGPITIVDIGGQDNKIIKINASGQRASFKMNRKCAAGTGAFLEEMALRLRLPIEELDSLARSADGEVTLGSYCTVFSATEVLEKIKAGHPVDRIVRGLFRSVIKRILEMDTLTDTVVLTGGVIEHNPFLAELLKEHTTAPIRIPPHPQITGALGAALYAMEN
ncbi:MAG: ATPase [Desulfomonile tiedjei]|uniref:ATPase n=1 Tax=Desulfomonile tiedjei TaxID=2358 RepID=A0A9D6V0N6_9BACT|nr:ATPase [Desulfomonile tiedjei]